MILIEASNGLTEELEMQMKDPEHKVALRVMVRLPFIQ